MKHFLSFFITILLFLLWFFPAYMIHYSTYENAWGILYVPIVVMSWGWGHILWESYY